MALQRQAFALERQGPAAVPPSEAARVSESELWVAVHLPQLAARSDFERLAVWADCITPRVDLDVPDSLLLEVRGSLKLLGGLAAIERKIEVELGARGLAFGLCAAPTARGALWLARYGAADHVTAVEQLPGRLGALPVSVTGWPESVLELLGELGVRSIGACLRLPRDGFARRVGVEYLHELDCALGKRADPRATFRALPELSVRLELPSETERFDILARAAERLAERMTDLLRTHQCQAQRFEVVIAHRDRAPTCEAVGLLEPVYQKQRLLEPLLARLERSSLPAPAVSLEIRAGALEPIAPGTDQLFEQGLGSLRSIEAEAELVERLRGRLGASGVHGLELVADHRPERGWSQSLERPFDCGVRSAGLSPWAQKRPLWLLAPALPLEEGLERLRCRGPLRVEPDPERIEGGWWDGCEVRRDYHAAATGQGERLWVYRDRTTGDWYLHGIFG